MNEKQMTARIRSAAIRIALEAGIRSPRRIRDLIRNSRKGVKKMSVAGVAAAVTRGE